MLNFNLITTQFQFSILTSTYSIFTASIQYIDKNTTIFFIRPVFLDHTFHRPSSWSQLPQKPSPLLSPAQ